MHRFVRFVLLAALAGLLAPSLGWADLQLTLTPSSPTTTVGGTVDVNVYLTETGGTILADELLFSAAFQLSFHSPLGIAEVASASHITPNSAFDSINQQTTDTVNGIAVLDLAAFFNPLVSPDSNNEIFLGTFTFTGLSAGSVTLTATPLGDATTSYNVTGNVSILDAQISSSSVTLQVEGSPAPAAVPAPGGLVLLGAAGVCLGSLGWRRKKAA